MSEKSMRKAYDGAWKTNNAANHSGYQPQNGVWTLQYGRPAV